MFACSENFNFKGRVRKLMSLSAFATLIAATACNQQDAPADAQPLTRSRGAGSDQTAVAEAIVTLLFIAGKRAQESGECDELKQRVEFKRLLCERFARQKANDASSEQSAGSNAPKG
jgi:hypothetical protein